MDGMAAPGGVMEALLSRASNGALREPGPDAAALETMIAAGLRAPDHGRLAPWRFLAIRGAAKQQLAEVCIAALRARDPAATEAEAERMRGKLTAPPLVLVLGVHVTASPKVPEEEQVQAVAAAAMNVLNAAHALGFAGKWVTGPNAYDPAVARALGFPPPHRLAGFIYLGTPAEPPLPLKRPDVSAHLSDWTG